MITKSIKPKIVKCNIKIVYHLIVQVHSIYHNVSYVVIIPTSFICSKARLATRDLSFICLHSIEITHIITKNEIITVTNKNTFKI